MVFIPKQKKKILEGFAEKKAFHLVSLGRIFPGYFVERRVTSRANTAPFFKRFENFPTPLLVFFVPGEAVQYEEGLNRFGSKKIMRVIRMNVDIRISLVANFLVCKNNKIVRFEVILPQKRNHRTLETCDEVHNFRGKPSLGRSIHLVAGLA